MRARLLGAVVPERVEDLRGEAREMALNRMIAGRHYPSDVAAGIALGEAVAGRMLAEGKMDDDLAAAKAEWRAVSGQ
jgi:hypothetical protein